MICRLRRLRAFANIRPLYMKKIVLYAVVVVAILMCILILVRKKPSSGTAPDMPSPTRVVIHTAPQTNQNHIAATNKPSAWVRPPGVDAAGWAYMLTVRKILLHENQPVEFYARVANQNGEPISGARLDLNLSYVDEEKVASPEFLRMQMGSEQTNKTLVLYSDARGWVKLTGLTGKALRIESLIKEGYSWTMPLIDSFGYEPEGKHSIGYAGMEDAFNPAKGYIFHMEKLDENNSTNSTGK